MGAKQPVTTPATITVAETVRAHMSSRSMSMPTLAEQSGMALSTLHRRLCGDGSDFTVKELAGIARVLDVTPRDLLGLAGAA